METKNKTAGFIYAIISAITFGLMPLFSVPVLKAGMETPSILIYRFGFGALFILLTMMLLKISPKINFSQCWRLLVLALFSDVSGICTIMGYDHMASGPAATILFSYPVFTCLIMMIFFNEKPTLRMVLAIVLAIAGVAGLSGMFSLGKGDISWLGTVLELGAGLTYAIYLVLVPSAELGEDMTGLKLTFYVFLFGAIMLLPYAMLTGPGFQWPVNHGTHAFDWEIMGSLVMLALIPTAVSNYTAVLALQEVGSTLTSIMGAFEPLTAITVGIIVFSEPFTPVVAVSAVLIIIAVTLLVLKK